MFNGEIDKIDDGLDLVDDGSDLDARAGRAYEPSGIQTSESRAACAEGGVQESFWHQLSASREAATAGNADDYDSFETQHRLGIASTPSTADTPPRRLSQIEFHERGSMEKN